MTKIHMITNASYNFKAPNISVDADKVIEVVFPTQEKQTISADGNFNLPIQRAYTHVELTVEADLTVTGVIGDDLKIGDMVLVAATANGDDRTLTFASNLGGKSVDLTQNNEEIIVLVFDGENFKFLAAGTGTNGNDGADGASISAAAGAPDNANGNNGDLYINTTDGELYSKAAGVWGSVGNIKGPDGDDGDNGTGISAAAGAPDNANGNNGDLYINTTDGELYSKAAGVWGSVGNIKGPEGPAYAPADNSIAVAKLVKGADDQNTYTLKSVNGVVQWVQDGL